MRKKFPAAITRLPGEQIKKHVGAIHTSGDLSLVERKAVNVLLLNAYDSLLTSRTHKLPVAHLCAMLGWTDEKNSEYLKGVLHTLSATPIEFNIMEDGKESWKVMSMLSYGEIKDGVCIYRYDEYLAERLYDPEIYATINIGVQRRFDGGYAFTLYENCLRYKSVGSTGWWDIARFRKLIGANAPLYDEFKYLKREAIVKPVEEINRVSDMHLEAEFQKKGRSITAVRFLITENPQQSLLQPEVIDEHAAVRESDTFKRLREHGIGDRLAIAWVLQDKERADAAIEYVEEKDRQKEIRGSTAGYIRKLIEDGSNVGAKPAYEIKKEAAAKEKVEKAVAEKKSARQAELEAEYKRQTALASIKKLTDEERHDLVMIYKESEGQGRSASYNPKTGKFGNAIERIAFDAWLRPQFAPETNTPEFIEWAKEKLNK